MKYAIFVLTVVLASCAPQSHTANDPGDNLRPFVDSFYAAWGGPQQPIQYFFVPLLNKAAECRTSDNGQRSVNINLDLWDFFCPAEQKAIVWHELGHCILGRSHVELPARSYLNVKIPSCEYITENEEALDQEMFE